MERLLSVIVPVYNTEQYLCNCIESIRNQSLKEIEIILVDDGSTDRSGMICDDFKYSDSRILVIHQKNQGPIASRISGIKKAKSKYITFVDSDDFVSEKSFELALSDIKKEIDVISFGIIRYFDNDNKRYHFDRYKTGKYDELEIKNSIYPSMIWNIAQGTYGIDPSLCNKIIKKELLEEVYIGLKNVSFHYGEDAAVIYPLLFKTKTLAIHNEAYYYHRQRQKTETAGYLRDDKYFERLYELYAYLINCFKEYEDFKQQIDLFYSYSVQLGTLKYGLPRQSIRYMFPFDKVEKGENIVLYGAGNVGHCYMEQLLKLNYCKVVLWVDKNFDIYNDDRIKNPKDIQNVDFHKIVIAIAEKNIRSIIKSDLKNLGVVDEDIID